MSELIQVVDEHNRPVRGATTEEIYRHGLRHRVVRVMLEASDGRVLLRRRYASKTLYPGRWDNSAAGKVAVGETEERAALRETGEELGVFGLSLQQADRFYSDVVVGSRRLCEFNTVYRAIIGADTRFQFVPGEVETAQWFTRPELHDLITDSAESCTPGLILVANRLYEASA